MGKMVYLAGPIDHGQDLGVAALRQELKRELHGVGLAVFDPSRPFEDPVRDPVAMHDINRAALEACSGVIAIADGTSIGTPMEIAEAVRMEKPVAALGGRWSLQLAALPVAVFAEADTEEAVKWLGVQVALSENWRPYGSGERLRWMGEEEFQPVRAYDGDAGYDLVASESTHVPFASFVDVPCGISVEMPSGTWALITGRSSTLRKRQLLVAQGVIDEGYRGPLFAGVWNLGPKQTVVERGERVAQLIPFRRTSAELELERVEELSESDRGERGFGSSGP